MQIRFKPEENHFDTCLLEDSDEETDVGVTCTPLYEKPVCLNSSLIGLSRLSDNPELGYDESDSE